MENHCLITGCDITMEGARQHGDLWIVGSAYVFNAVGEMTYDPEFCGSDKVLHVTKGSFTFVRRNVIVVNMNDAKLNEAAEQYLRPETRL
jgi:hypothetical protein